ncbi:MAG: S1 RNA-binding domain-containing protein [Abditibacteriales bacterium]|nr:S1 RNA-binding domain-containing protein [Abditibacteriales bacterium]MDW8367607.1 S1 RNA-binding domain-containing protein [Abditibacteriales bacterium]
MAVEVGSIVEGTVVKLLPYGVLVKLPDGATGLVHISEIDDRYVRDVNEYFQVNDSVSVKVLNIGERGRYELSVRQARSSSEGGSDDPLTERTSRRYVSPEERESFENKLSDFLRHSNERLLDLKRNIESKRGGKRGR